MNTIYKQLLLAIHSRLLTITAPTPGFILREAVIQNHTYAHTELFPSAHIVPGEEIVTDRGLEADHITRAITIKITLPSAPRGSIILHEDIVGPVIQCLGVATTIEAIGQARWDYVGQQPAVQESTNGLTREFVFLDYALTFRRNRTAPTEAGC